MYLSRVKDTFFYFADLLGVTLFHMVVEVRTDATHILLKLLENLVMVHDLFDHDLVVEPSVEPGLPTPSCPTLE